MREDFLIDRQHFYLDHPGTVSVHPPGTTTARASYLNALHDVHQLYGHFSDDEDNEYYPADDVHADEVLPSPDIEIVDAFGHTAFDSSQEIVVVSNSFPPGSYETGDRIETVVSCPGGGVDQVAVAVDVGAADSNTREIFKPKPEPKGIDVAVVSTSEDEA
ncbi:hypothetical protein MKW92_014380 [Papaver armeniacum]|nr:hypothetical protein MKW92_014380 [Papaver armeniacum]